MNYEYMTGFSLIAVISGCLKIVIIILNVAVIEIYFNSSEMFTQI